MAHCSTSSCTSLQPLRIATRACVEKTQNRRKLAGRSTREPKDFGDLATVDHVYMRDSHGRSGVGGYTDSLTVLDVGAGCQYSEPVDTLDAAETARVLQYLRGDDFIYRVYSDSHRSLRKLAKC